jgi:hypothetical protein
MTVEEKLNYLTREITRMIADYSDNSKTVGHLQHGVPYHPISEGVKWQLKKILDYNYVPIEKK